MADDQIISARTIDDDAIKRFARWLERRAKQIADSHEGGSHAAYRGGQVHALRLAAQALRKTGGDLD